MAIALAWLAIALLSHPVGDHYTESDFYGAYADGARALLRGQVDPTRYGIYGPLYEWLLAIAGAAGADLFSAARLVSVASALVTVAAWWTIVAAALGRGAARWAAVLIAATPVFTRYAYSATTDMPAAALGSVALALLVNGRGLAAIAGAGALAALATLTRYQALVLLPIGVLAILALRGAAGRAAWPRRAAVYAAAFLLALAPWCSFSLARGFVPGQGLVAQYGFYVAEDGSRNVQDRPRAAAGAAENTLGALLRDRPRELVERLGARTLEHLGHDARVLLGHAFAAAAFAGALLWGTWRVGRYGGALAVAGLLLYLGLVPAFYSDRYRLLLLPVYAAAAAALWPALAARGRPGRIVAALALLAALLPLGSRNVATQVQIATELPRDVLNLAPALAAVEPGAVLARKGHIGYHAGRAVVPFPRVTSVEDLGELATRAGARFLYYSWYEANLRPEFRCLLDTTRTLPGLERVAVSEFPPAVLYRIGPGFGEPGWYADDRDRAVSEARAAIWALQDSAAARGYAVLAADAYLGGDPGRARHLARTALAAWPGERLATWIDSLSAARLAGVPASRLPDPPAGDLRRTGWITRPTAAREAPARRPVGTPGGAPEVEGF